MRYLLPIFFLFGASHTSAQWNHAPNPSFEQYVNCPTTHSQVSTHCVAWYQYTLGTSDYYNTCASGSVNVPNTQLGYQQAAHGNAFVGLFTFDGTTSTNQKEYVAANITPLQVGFTYEVSMSVSLANSCSWGTNDLGVLFYDNAPSPPSPPLSFPWTVLPVTPQVSYSSYGAIVDSQNWVRLVGTFYADSAYDKVVIGGFKPYSSMTKVAAGGNMNHTYYFIDSVVIRLDERVKINLNDTVFCAGDTINVPYAVQANGYFATGNTFTLQLSNATGSFAAPVNIGSVAATTSGTIQAVLPPGASGSGYRLRLIANNLVDTSKTSPKNILIKSRPVPAAGTNAPICAGSTLSITATALPGSSYSWSGPSYSSSQQNNTIPSSTTAHSGNYIVTATLNGCAAKDTVAVLVKPMPAVPAATNNGPLCPGDTLHLTSQSVTNGVTYTWAGPASFGSALQDPSINSVTAAHSGMYNVTASFNGCTSAAGNTTVVVKPEPGIPAASSNSPVCAGGVLNLTANSSTPGANYYWTGPNNFTSIQQNPTLSPVLINGTGTYKVAAELNGCISDTGVAMVVVNNVSSLGIYPSPNDTLCELSPNATLVAVPFNAGTSPQYQWYKNNNIISGATNVSYPATGIADGDSFQCRMIVTGQCPQPLTLFSNKIGMTLLPMTTGPSVTITADPAGQLKPWQMVKFTAVAANAGTDPKYQWKRNGQNVAGATSFTWSANNLSHNDTVTCEVTSSTWCANPPSAQSNRIDINIALGIDEVNDNGALRLYPNPNNGAFTLELEKLTGTATLEVVNVIGQTVYRSQIADRTSQITLPGIMRGIYLLRVSGTQLAATMRIIVER